jgi:hypothetical protein
MMKVVQVKVTSDLFDWATFLPEPGDLREPGYMNQPNKKSGKGIPVILIQSSRVIVAFLVGG